MKLLILIPTYNEVHNIEKILKKVAYEVKKIKNVKVSIYVIDDSSPDGTAMLSKKIAFTLKTKQLEIKTLIKKRKEGLGKAYLFAFNKILNQAHKKDIFILQMDADFSHNPIYIHNFINEARKGASLILSSRYLKGGGIVGWRWYRKIISICGNFYARLLLKGTLTDYTSGYNMFSLDLLREVNFEMLDVPGYGFLINLKYS